MAAKYGTPYFSNYVNSDMKPSDIRSMAILPDQEVIYQNVIDGSEDVHKSRIQDLVRAWKENAEAFKLKMLMNGKFVDVTEMFEIPYDSYDTYVEIELANGYKQPFSYDHKCVVLRDGKIMDVLSQDVKAGDIALIAKYPFNEGSATDTSSYDLGFVAGLFYTHGYRINQKPMIRINVNPELVDTVTRVFKNYEISKKRINNFWLLTISGPNGEDPYDEISDYIGTFDDGFSIYEINHVKDGVLNQNSIFRREFLRGATYFSINKAQLSFTLSDEKDMMSMKNVIAIASSVGENFDLHIEEDTIVLDNLKLTSRVTGTDDYYGIPIVKVTQLDSDYDYVYNFTVDTPEHLYTLPNGMITHQCCRLRLDLTELRRKNGGFFGSGESTGSVGVVTINLPKLAYESENKEEFYEKLDHIMDIAARSLDTKRKVVTKLLNAGFYPYTKRYLGHFDNHFSTIGLVGMNEAGLNAKWIGAGMRDKRTQEWAEELLNHMRDRLIIYQQQYGALFNLESTPAESTAYRFAKHDKERYPDIKTANDKGTPYYTNSTNLPVGYTEDVFDALDIQDRLQVLYTSGTVFHAFLGEKLPSWQSAAKMVKTICDNYRLPYITLSPTYSVCKNHGYLTGEVYKCPDCGEETEVYSRITGYYRPVKNWNDGKAQEFKDRKEYKYSEASLDAKEEQMDDEITDLNDIMIENPEMVEIKTLERPILLSTEMCPNCRVVKSFIESHHLDVEMLDATEGKGAKIADEYGIATAPTLITRDGDVVNKVSDILKILQ